jgi:hypothetical protein
LSIAGPNRGVYGTGVAARAAVGNCEMPVPVARAGPGVVTFALRRGAGCRRGPRGLVDGVRGSGSEQATAAHAAADTPRRGVKP